MDKSNPNQKRTNEPMGHILVLNDGETFSSLNGCTIFAIPDDWDTDRIEQALADEEISPVQTLVAIEDATLSMRMSDDS